MSGRRSGSKPQMSALIARSRWVAFAILPRLGGTGVPGNLDVRIVGTPDFVARNTEQSRLHIDVMGPQCRRKNFINKRFLGLALHHDIDAAQRWSSPFGTNCVSMPVEYSSVSAG